MESRIKSLERGSTGATIKINSKKTEKYNPSSFNKSGNFNTDAEVQLTKKQKRVEPESEDEEEVVVKKPKKKQKVEEDSD